MQISPDIIGDNKMIALRAIWYDGFFSLILHLNRIKIPNI